MSISHGIFIRSVLLILLFLSNAQAKTGHEKQLNIYLNPKFEFDDISKKYRIVGATNLPDGYKISVYIKRKESGWVSGLRDVNVKNGIFYSDFLISLLHSVNKNGTIPPSELSPGFYNLSFVGALASIQPKTVQKVIGKDGEFLEGKTIKNFNEELKDCVGKNGEFLKGKVVNILGENVKCSVSNYVDFRTKIKLDGEESVEADNKVGEKVLEEFVAGTIPLIIANEGVPYVQRKLASQAEEANLCKQENLPGICFAQLKQKWYIEDCQKKYNADHNEKKLNECLDKF